MCGILAVHGIENPADNRARFIALSKRLRHRGPDWSGCFVGKDSILVHERLAIVGVGAPHFRSRRDHGKQILAVNGEIYNHDTLRATLSPDIHYKTRSDCEVILPLVCLSR
jgi:asparagine synthase (glutamine-hydrolysing)